MVKIAFMLSLLVLINASTLSLTPADVSTFLSGFFTGLQTDPSVQSTCATDFVGINSDTSKLVADILLLLNNQKIPLTTIVNDFQELVQGVAPLSADCKFPQLVLALTKVLGPNGYSIVMRNYFKNMQVVSNDLAHLQSCGTDYESCGLYAGELFRYLVGFSLGDHVVMITEEAVVGLKSSNYEDLLTGLLRGLQTDPSTDSQCVSDFLGLEGNLNKIVEDIQELVGGNTSALFKLINDIKSLQVPNMIEECNIVGLADQIEVLAGPNGFMTLWVNYSKNEAKITEDLEVIKTCENDYLTCGESLGNMFQLLVGWSI